MALNISDSFVRQYDDVIRLVAQQLSSKLRGSVMEKQVTGKDFTAERVSNPTDVLAVIASQHADTVYSDMSHSRRTGKMVSRAGAVLIDDEDKLRMLADPTSAYVQELAGQFNRTVDDIIIEQFLGNAFSGETGSTTVALPSTQQLAHGGTSLTLDKLKTAHKMFMANHVDTDREELFLAVNAEGWDALAKEAGLTNADNVNYRVNVDYKLGNVAGFTLIKCERLTKYAGTSSASTNRPAIAFTKKALELGVGMDMKLAIDTLPMKNNNIQILLKATLGAVRVHDEHVIDIRFQE